MMVLTKNSICDFGLKARDFTLKGVDGKTYTLADVRGPKGTIVVFICNHCPYVKASIGRIVAEAKVLREIGIGTIAIMPNDTDCTPDFFGFNAQDELQYRGRLDASRTTLVPNARRDLFEAMKQVAETGHGPEDQTPSMGCSIKWKD